MDRKKEEEKRKRKMLIIMWPSPMKSVLSYIWGAFKMCTILKTAAPADYFGI